MASWGTLELTLFIRYQGFSIEEPAKSPFRVAPFGHTCPHLGKEVISSLKLRLHTRKPLLSLFILMTTSWLSFYLVGDTILEF